MDATTVNVGLLSITAATGLYTSLLPDLQDLRRANLGDHDVVADVRVGEIAATALTVAIGLTASSLIKNPVPAMLSIVAAGAMLTTYESVLHTQVIHTGKATK